MIGHRAFRLWVVAALAGFLLIAACGASSGQDTEEAGSLITSRPAAKRSGANLPELSRVPAPCSEGSAALGQPAGAIDFHVRCKSQKPGEETSFFVTRAPLHGQGSPGIHAFQRHPSLSGPNGRHRFGRCIGFSGGGISCSLRSDRSTLVNGRIWVDAETRCDFELIITASSPSRPCRSDCTAVQQVLTILAGRPPGC